MQATGNPPEDGDEGIPKMVIPVTGAAQQAGAQSVMMGGRGREKHLEKKEKKKKRIDYLCVQLYSRECQYSIKEFVEELMINT